jgi:hypothetical protein
MKPIKRHAALAAVTIATTGLAACGGSDEKTSPAGADAPPPESRIAPAAEVSIGLKRLTRVADDVAGAHDPAQAKTAAALLEPIWMRIEGTVRRNDPDAYIGFEDNLALLQSGDTAKAKDGARKMSAAVSAYLSKYPG